VIVQSVADFTVIGLTEEDVTRLTSGLSCIERTKIRRYLLIYSPTEELLAETMQKTTGKPVTQE
jgi:hypothetical protein